MTETQSTFVNEAIEIRWEPSIQKAVAYLVHEPGKSAVGLRPEQYTPAITAALAECERRNRPSPPPSEELPEDVIRDYLPTGKLFQMRVVGDVLQLRGDGEWVVDAAPPLTHERLVALAKAYPERYWPRALAYYEREMARQRAQATAESMTRPATHPDLPKLYKADAPATVCADDGNIYTLEWHQTPECDDEDEEPIAWACQDGSIVCTADVLERFATDPTQRAIVRAFVDAGPPKDSDPNTSGLHDGMQSAPLADATPALGDDNGIRHGNSHAQDPKNFNVGDEDHQREKAEDQDTGRSAVPTEAGPQGSSVGSSDAPEPPFAGMVWERDSRGVPAIQFGGMFALRSLRNYLHWEFTGGDEPLTIEEARQRLTDLTRALVGVVPRESWDGDGKLYSEWTAPIASERNKMCAERDTALARAGKAEGERDQKSREAEALRETFRHEAELTSRLCQERNEARKDRDRLVERVRELEGERDVLLGDAAIWRGALADLHERMSNIAAIREPQPRPSPVPPDATDWTQLPSGFWAWRMSGEPNRIRVENNRPGGWMIHREDREWHGCTNAFKDAVSLADFNAAREFMGWE